MPGSTAGLEFKDSDPIGYEKLFARLRGGLVSARETALNISASPIVRELGELCFALYTPEGDSVALSTGIIVHVHTMSDAIKYMVRSGYEDNPGIRPGDIFANNDPTIGDVHNADVQTFVPIFWEGELIALGRGSHARPRHRRVDARRRPGRAHQPARRRDRPSLHEDRRGGRAGAVAPDPLHEADACPDVLPARRADSPGRLPHDPGRGGAVAPRGGDRTLQAVQPRGDRGGPALVQGPGPRDDRPRPLSERRQLRRHLRRQGDPAGAGAAGLRHARPLRGADRRRRRLRPRPRRHLGLGLALDELHAVGDAGCDLGDVHADADLQRQGQRRRLPGDRDQLPRGHDREPRRRRGVDRDRLGVPAAGLPRLRSHARPRPAGAGVHRGGDGALLGLRQRHPGRRHRPVRQLLGDHELRDRGAGDGGQVRARRHRHLRGDVQPRGRRRRRRDVGADLPDDLSVAADQGELGRRRASPRRLELRIAADGLEDAVLGAPEPGRDAHADLRGLRRVPRVGGVRPQHQAQQPARARRGGGGLPPLRRRASTTRP